jgi:hypothetical protein
LPVRVKKTRQKKTLQPGPYQRDVGRARRQQGCHERELDTLPSGGLEDRSHGLEHPAILAGESRGFFFAGGGFFFGGFMSRLRLRDSRQNGPKRANYVPCGLPKTAGMAAQPETQMGLPR